MTLKNQKQNPSAVRGFTLVELLVVIAIISILVLVLMPAISGTRESARRAQCLNRMGKLVLALHDYEMNQGVFPPGTVNHEEPVLSQEAGLQQSWTIQTLPFLEETNVFQAIDSSVSVYADENRAIRRLTILPFLCPSASGSDQISSYAAVHSDREATIDSQNNGVFFLNSKVSRGQISDGLKYTLFLGEKLPDGAGEFGWMAGNRSTLRNTGWTISHKLPGVPDDFYSIEFSVDVPGSSKTEIPKPPEQDAEQEDLEDPLEKFQQAQEVTEVTLDPVMAKSIEDGNYVGGFGSEHRDAGAVMAFGDGTVKYFSIGTDKTVLRRLGNRADSELINANELN